MKTHPDYPYHSPNQYLVSLIDSKLLTPLKLSDQRIKPLIGLLKEWGEENFLEEIKVSGSTLKGTALKGKADLDLFLSLNSGHPDSLSDIYNSLWKHIEKNRGRFRLTARRQNVSIRIGYKEFKIDVVPGKRHYRQRHWHNIHVRRDPKDRTMTNIDAHAYIVKSSGLIDEIIALKIWKHCHQLDFPSIYLELLTIDVLKGKHRGKTYLARNVLDVLEYISKYMVSKAVKDPINTSNTISHSLTRSEKRKIQNAAERSLRSAYLSEVIW